MSTDQRSAPIGTMYRRGGVGVVRMEDTFAIDPEGLWAALTEPERLARWIAAVEGDLRPGGTVKMRFTSGWEGEGRVDVCDPHRRLLLTFSPGTADETQMEAVLTGSGSGTVLVIEDRGLPVAELPFHGAGWQIHVEDLARLVAGEEQLEWRPRWEALTPDYQARTVSG